MTKESLFRKFKKKLFATPARRLGTSGELLCQYMYNLRNSGTTDYDKVDADTGNHVEIKFTTAKKGVYDAVISADNLIPVIVSTEKVFKHNEANSDDFDFCAIHQIKKWLFDKLLYGIIFKDRIEIFSVTPDKLIEIPTYSERKSGFRPGEGEFFITHDNIDYHRKNNLISIVPMRDFFDMFYSPAFIVS